MSTVHRFWLIGVLCACLAAPALAGPTAAPATPPVPAKPVEIRGVKNFTRVSDNLYRGAQPTREGYQELKKLGIKTIVNARSSQSDLKLLKGLGLQYIHISCEASKPQHDDALVFMKVLQDPANYPVFIHCRRGADRTGHLVGVYRILEQGWPYDAVAAEMKKFRYNTKYTRITDYLRDLDPAQFKQDLKAAQPPKVGVIN